MSHGFPKNSAPLFRSTKFHIENRPGLEDQSTERVIKELVKLNATEVTPGSGGNYSKKRALAEWMSDWHLIAFLETTQLFPHEDIRTLIQVASSPNLLNDLTMLDKVLQSDGWKTLMAFTGEIGCKWFDLWMAGGPLTGLTILLFKLPFDRHPSPLGQAVAWMKISLQKSLIKYENRKWLLGAGLRRGSGSVSTVRLRTLTTGRIARSAVFRCDKPRCLEQRI